MQDFLWDSHHQHAPTRLQSNKDPNPGTESMKVWLSCLVETTLERGNHDKEKCQLNVCFSSFNFVNDLSHILIHTLSVFVGFFTHTTLLLILTSCALWAELATAWSFTYCFGQHFMCEGRVTLVYVGVVCGKWMVPKFQTHQSGCTTFSWHSSVSLLPHSKVVSRRQESNTFMDLVPCLGPCYLAIWWRHAGGGHPTEDPALRV